MTTERGRERGKGLAEAIESAIDRGTARVENIHKSIADLPFKMLEERELLRAPAREVRRVQNRAIKAVYDLVRTINHQASALASDLRHQVARRRRAHGEVSAGHHPGTHQA
jgi:hypothetical protein